MEHHFHSHSDPHASKTLVIYVSQKELKRKLSEGNKLITEYEVSLASLRLNCQSKLLCKDASFCFCRNSSNSGGRTEFCSSRSWKKHNIERRRSALEG